jgi:hypothetical protein
MAASAFCKRNEKIENLNSFTFAYFFSKLLKTSSANFLTLTLFT